MIQSMEEKLAPDRKSRRIPTTKEFLANKKLNEKLYGILQAMSTTKEEDGKTIRFVYKKKVNKTEIADNFEISRQAISRYFSALIKYGFLKEIKIQSKGNCHFAEAYELPEDSKLFVPIEFDTLIYLLNVSNADVIKVYTYLFNKDKCKKYSYGNEGKYEFTFVELTSVLGLSLQGYTNKKIRDILNVLTLLGLIECSWNYKYNENSKFTLNIIRKYVDKTAKHRRNENCYYFEDALYTRRRKDDKI